MNATIRCVWRYRFLIFVGVAMLCSKGYADESAAALYQRCQKSVLALKVETKSGQSFTASAFLAKAPGIAVTACHVLRGMKEMTATFADGTTIPIEGVRAIAPEWDLAFLSVPDSDRPRLTLGRHSPRIGTKVYTIGSPRGYNFSITDGIVSQVRELDGLQQLQITCPISPGSSGSPVLTPNGNVIGFVSWTQSDAQNISFAIPSKWIMEQPIGSRRSWEALPELGSVLEPSHAAVRPDGRAETIPLLRKILREGAGGSLRIQIEKGGSKKTYRINLPDDFEP